MSKITVSFESSATSEQVARDRVTDLAYDASTKGARNLTFVAFEPDAAPEPEDTSVEGRIARIEDAIARIAERL